MNEKYLVSKQGQSYIVENQNKKLVLDKDTFLGSDYYEITKKEYYKRLNDYFKAKEHQWVYNGNQYRNMQYFTVDEQNNITNISWLDIPKHFVSKMNEDMIYVFHLGKVYLCTRKKDDVVQLYSPQTLKKMKMTRITNCAPVYNITKKEMI
jgi:hypothetical protein